VCNCHARIIQAIFDVSNNDVASRRERVRGTDEFATVVDNVLQYKRIEGNRHRAVVKLHERARAVGTFNGSKGAEVFFERVNAHLDSHVTIERILNGIDLWTFKDD
jgi:hypothetical protein